MSDIQCPGCGLHFSHDETAKSESDNKCVGCHTLLTKKTVSNQWSNVCSQCADYHFKATEVLASKSKFKG